MYVFPLLFILRSDMVFVLIVFKWHLPLQNVNRWQDCESDFVTDRGQHYKSHIILVNIKSEFYVILLKLLNESNTVFSKPI